MAIFNCWLLCFTDILSQWTNQSVYCYIFDNVNFWKILFLSYFWNEIQYNVIKNFITPAFMNFFMEQAYDHCFVIVVFVGSLHRTSFIYTFVLYWSKVTDNKKEKKVNNYNSSFHYYVLSWMLTIPNEMFFVHSLQVSWFISTLCKFFRKNYKLMAIVIRY